MDKNITVPDFNWGDFKFQRHGEPSEITSLLTEDQSNPWLTLGIMDDIEDESLLAEWDKVLDLQTRMLGEKEIAWLSSQGFGASPSGLLEVGSANGNYGSYLARRFPGTTIFGIEANPHLASRLAADNCPDNYSIDVCKVGNDPLPNSVVDKFDQCLLRFVAQHVSDPVRLMRAVYDSLPEGGRLYVIEEDDAFFTSNPKCHSFETVFDMWRRVTAAGGSNSKIGRSLPEIASRAGFKVDAFDIVLRNNVESGQFRELFMNVVRMFHRTSPELVSLADMQAAVDGLLASDKENTLATYPQFYLAATKE
jgi:SAM-dependent methyltransferase